MIFTTSAQEILFNEEVGAFFFFLMNEVGALLFNCA